TPPTIWPAVREKLIGYLHAETPSQKYKGRNRRSKTQGEGRVKTPLTVKYTRRMLIGGIAAAGLLGTLILLAAIWSSSSLKTAARAEADALRILYADQIEAARLEGDAELAALQSEISTRRSDIERQIIEGGAELSNIADERDATRVALEELVDFRNRIGLELIEYRGRVIFVVPDGSELLAWRAPGLSEIASYNGRMYRIHYSD
ncbi:MAG: hypothetical protein AAF999_17705, partial [Pseudomonadota bacterium]